MTNKHAETTLLLVDDHQLFRDGLIELLQTVPGFTVVGQAGTGQEAIEAANRLSPQVVLLDVELPGPGPVRLIRRLLIDSPRIGIIVLTMHDDPHLLRETVDAGARGYLLKSADRAGLTAAVMSAARPDDGSVRVEVSRATLLALGRESNLGPVSARERDVLINLTNGKNNREIAGDMHISEATVKRHLTNIYSKLGATSRLDAVRLARENGMLPVPPREYE